MKRFKAVPGKGIVASSNIKGSKRRAIKASTVDEFSRFQQECINEYENGGTLSDDLYEWLEETVMGEAISKAEEYYANKGIDFFAEPSGQMGVGSDDVTLTYSDGTEKTFSINLQEETEIALECVRDADNFNQCVDMVMKALYIQ